MPSPSHVPGQCFAKCKHVVWHAVPPWRKKSKEELHRFSCNFAHTLGCKAPGSKKTGYIDRKTNKWRTCLYDNPTLEVYE